MAGKLFGAFKFATLEAVILNKAISLVAVASALPFRPRAVRREAVIVHWHLIANLLAESLMGACPRRRWMGQRSTQTGCGCLRLLSTTLIRRPQPQGQRVTHHADTTERHRRACHDWTEQAQRRQRHANHVIDERPEQVLLNLPVGAA